MSTAAQIERGFALGDLHDHGVTELVKKHFPSVAAVMSVFDMEHENAANVVREMCRHADTEISHMNKYLYFVGDDINGNLLFATSYDFRLRIFVGVYDEA